jgi:quercetin dioxygenase-like cupin family protein
VRILDLRALAEHGRDIDRFGSTGARHLTAAQIPGAGVLGIVELAPGGGLGRHAAVVTQLFVVVAGEGWVTGADGPRVPVSAGDGVLWETGEEHESGTNTGLTAVVLEAPGLTVPSL